MSGTGPRDDPRARPAGDGGGGSERAGPSGRRAGPWRVQRHAGAPAAFHALSPPRPAERLAWVFSAERPALVLGSTQDRSVVDGAACAGAGVDVVRRRSGGGAVLVVPSAVGWVDLVLPASDALWSHDVGHSFRWVGELWCDALAAAGLPGATVHTGPMRRSAWSELVCFAGTGPGEVRLDGRKVVGISQRRTRDHARFQCAVLDRWSPGELLDLLALDPGDRAHAAGELAGVAAGVGEPHGPGVDVVVDALLARLPA